MSQISYFLLNVDRDETVIFEPLDFCNLSVVSELSEELGFYVTGVAWHKNILSFFAEKGNTCLEKIFFSPRQPGCLWP